ncbi:MAG: flagellar type III secretion system pore protein FliP [Pseudomonadota bacterium]|nr:flagellar type III secretion system pore protein FliP [Pseudomonadota bacterium]
MKDLSIAVGAFLLLVCCGAAWAEPGIPALTLQTGDDGGQNVTLSIQILALMTALTLLPALLLMMTGFTRIIIVLALLRQALGTPQTPPNQVLLGLALFLTFFIMTPVWQQVYSDGVEPYLDEEVAAADALTAGMAPVREFMLAQTREADLMLFADMAGASAFETADDVPLSILAPAFVTSELKTAFQIGFLVFIPFVIIDLVVASVLMAMGMMMLSPMLISLPFKVMLFVLVDGWVLVMGTLATSFYV